MFHQLILSFLTALLSLIILRSYDKFYNKQYTRKEYINQFFLVFISSITILYIDNHFSNYTSSQLINLDNTKVGGNYNLNENYNTPFNKHHQSMKPKSIIETNLNNVKMNFATGLPNF